MSHILKVNINTFASSLDRVIIYTSYLDDEKKQVLQLYGAQVHRSGREGNMGYCDLPTDIENPAVLVTG